MLVELVSKSAQIVIEENRQLIRHQVKKRSRFENWLQLEIFKKILMECPSLSVDVERSYPLGKGRCDFWCKSEDGVDEWVELKLCVTNYCRTSSESSSNRPITTQISDVVRDSLKLQAVTESVGARSILLLVYPLPADFRCHVQWNIHLDKLRCEAGAISEYFFSHIHDDDLSAYVAAYGIKIAACGAE